MPIKISGRIEKLITSEDANNADNLEQRLWDKSGGRCFLCDHEMDRINETLVPDHDLPEADGGPTTLSNLNLAHDGCNSFKRSHKTVNVRPYLKFLASTRRAAGGLTKYDGALALLEVEARPVDIDIVDKKCEIRLDPHRSVSAPVMEEVNSEGSFEFVYVELPRENIHNDDECQPRTIKAQQLWAIYNDLNQNPLHEAPGCRVVTIGEHSKIVMFDGQHKALATWLHGRSSIVAKVYLNIGREQTIRLVNSIQSKIKKLPLSPFELSAKMSEEWRDRVGKYEEAVGTDEASEAGFLKWIGSDERRRAKAAFEDALFQTVIESDDLLFKSIIQGQGEKKKEISITETAFRNKVLKPLIHTQPLEEVFEVSQNLRDRERDNIARLLNILFRKAFEPQNGDDFLENEKKRAKRLTYQSSLNYVSTLLKDLFGQRVVEKEGRALLEKSPSEEVWNTIEEDIQRLLDHPVWLAEFDRSEKMAAISEALSKNQDAAKSFGAVGMKLGYVAGVDSLESDALD